MTTTRLALRFALLLALLPACASTGPGSPPDPTWEEVEVETPSDRVLWKMVLFSVEKAGFPLAGGTDAAAGELTSGWKTNLQPFSGAGTRMRAEVHMKPKGPGVWVVRAHVQKQLNQALVSPLDPTRAEWEWTSDDPLEARVLLQHVVSALAPTLEVGGDAGAGGSDQRLAPASGP